VTTAEVAEHGYAARAERLQVMARDFEVLGDDDRAREARMGALMVFAAGRAEARNPANPPVQCGICLRANYCDIDVHLGRPRAAL
jgi:hypothetical protein